MAVRSSMAYLITLVRDRIYEPNPSPTGIFSDQQIQDKLDECRVDVRYEPLLVRPTFSNPGGIQYNDYYSTHQFWETDWKLIWGDFTTLTPTASEEIVGHWTFNNQLPPVLIAGKYYDVYRASADLLEEKIAQLAATQWSFTSDGQTFHPEQQITFLERRVLEYRHKQKARSVKVARNNSSESNAYGTAPDQAVLAGPVSAGVPFLTGE